MRRATFLASVKTDLIEILEHTAEMSGSVSLADVFVLQLRAKCNKLASFTATVGRPRPELRPDIRSFPFKSYVIFFRYIEDRFEVVKIVHSRRDIDAIFGNHIEKE